MATLAHGALLVLLVEVNAPPPWLASGAGAVLGAQIAFAGNRRFTFGHRGAWLPAWWRFMATAGLGAVVGMDVVAALTAAGLHYLLAKVVATVLVPLLTFAVNRGWSFRR